MSLTRNLIPALVAIRSLTSGKNASGASSTKLQGRMRDKNPCGRQNVLAISQNRFVHGALLLGLAGLALTSSATSSQSQSACSNAGTNSTNLTVCSASYLGGSGDDAGSAVEIAPDRTVVFGGTIAGTNLGKTPYNLPGGNGAVIRTDFTGRNVLSVTRVGGSVDDLDINRSDGKIAVVGDFGLSLLSRDGKQRLWTKNLGSGGGATASNGRRVAVSSLGGVATLFNKKITVFTGTGQQVGQFTPSGSSIEDLVIDGSNRSVIVTGFTQKDGGACSQLQVAFIRAYDYTGKLKWTAYDWSQSQAASRGSSCADTRGIRLALGRDNQLYFAGESAGGNSIYRYNPNFSNNQSAPNVLSDQYHNPFNTSSNHITYYARFNLSGLIQKGQFVLPRLSSGKGNTIRPSAITADQSGNVYIGGISAAYLANRDQLTISGKRLGTYAGGDGFLLVVSPDFRTRKLWTAWTGSAASSTTVRGIAAVSGTAAVISTSQGGMLTVSPVQANPGGGKDAFISTFVP